MQPIENVWGLMRGKISRQDDIAMTDDLHQALEEEWVQLGPEEVAPLVESMAGRMTELPRCRWWPHSLLLANDELFLVLSLLVGLLLLVREVRRSPRTTSGLLFFIVFFFFQTTTKAKTSKVSLPACLLVFVFS